MFGTHNLAKYFHLLIFPKGVSACWTELGIVSPIK